MSVGSLSVCTKINQAMLGGATKIQVFRVDAFFTFVKCNMGFQFFAFS